MPDVLERFRMKTERVSSGCLEWTAARFKSGYGEFWLNGKVKRAHHVAWWLEFGEWPDYLRHSCDNPPCVDVSHLLEGDPLSNARDRHTHGHSPRGIGNANVKLTERQVREIQRRYRPGIWGAIKPLAEEFGVCRQTILEIGTGKRWGHLAGPERTG